MSTKDTVLYSKEFDVLNALEPKDFEHSGTISSTKFATCPSCGEIGNTDKAVWADMKVQSAPDNPAERIVTSFIACGHCKRNVGWGFRVTDGETSTEGEKAPNEVTK